MANRHDVIIWDAKIYGLERDFALTAKHARALAQQQAEPSASLLRFADTAYSRSDLKNLDPAIVHYLQHLKENMISSKTAAFRVALPDHEPHEHLLRILMIEAIKHGLVLCDEPAELFVFQDGRIISNDLQLKANVEKATKYPTTLKQLYKLLQKDAAPLLMKHGFLEDYQEWFDSNFSVTYNKAINRGKLSLSISFKSIKGHFEPSLYFRIIEDHMIAIAQKSDFKYSMMLGGGCFLVCFRYLN